MKDFFTISEFANLRNININSLRYYEKLGLLRPALVDPDTGYRYYKAEQLTILDKILLCISLGIPLKEMAEYIDQDGNLHSQELLEHGRKIALDRMNQLQNTLHFIDFSLKSMENNREFADKKETYVRHLDERRIITSDFFFTSLNIKEVVSEVARIYKAAQKEELFPILPAGQLFQMNTNGDICYRLFLQILAPEKQNSHIMELPSGNYSCMRMDLTASTNLLPMIKDCLEQATATVKDPTVIIDNIILDKYSYGSRPSELQVYQSK